MKIEYDKEADAMYIRLQEGDFQCRNVRLNEDVALDFAAESGSLSVMGVM